MSTRDEFLKALKKQAYAKYGMPGLNIEPSSPANPVGQFAEMTRFVGGNVFIAEKTDSLRHLLSSLYPEARSIASNLAEMRGIATVNPDGAEDPRSLDNLDLAVIEGKFGVVENGCVWVQQETRRRVVYFIAEHLVILLDKTKLVATMHDAYRLLEKEEYGFGVFISGPSKTADIEQALVVGAHGACGVTVVLR